MTEEKEVKPGEVYENADIRSWILITIKKRSDGTFYDRDYAYGQKIKTFEILEEIIDCYFIKATRIDDSEITVEFGIKSFINYITTGKFKLISKPKAEENHEGMHYNAYSDTWHWGIF